jgi:hypothetical protein
VTIEKGAAFAVGSRGDKAGVRFEYTADEPLVINLDALPPDPLLPGKKSFTAFRWRKAAVRMKCWGYPRQAGQRFTLAHSGLILRASGLDTRATGT